VDPLADEAGAVPLVEPVRIREPLVRPDLDSVVTPAASLLDDRAQQRRPGAAASRLSQDVQPLEGAVVGQPRSADDAALLLGDEERDV
jgi:hypothetical protein